MALGAELLVLAKIATAKAARAQLEKTLRTGEAAERFQRMVAGLAAPMICRRAQKSICRRRPSSAPSMRRRSGKVEAIDTRAFGLAVIELGGGRRVAADKIDHAVGLTALAGKGDAVRRVKTACLHPCPRRSELRARPENHPRRLHPGKTQARHTLRHRAHCQMSRAFLFILDSFGIGGAPDAEKYGDEGANTFVHIAESTELHISPIWPPSALALPPKRRREKIPWLPPRSKANGDLPNEISNGKDTVPATGKLPACRFSSTGAISPASFRLSKIIDR